MAPDVDIPRDQITGVILAGGRGQRMGGVDKGLVALGGKPMVALALDALRPQVGTILINANRNIDEYAAFGHEVVSDGFEGFLGPLAGLASAMQAAKTDYLLTVPCDSPLLARDLAARLYAALRGNDADISVAHDGERLHPVFALLKRPLLPSLLDYLSEGGRKIDVWFARHALAIADLRDRADTFINVNSPEERAALEARLTVAGK